jgi:hypothetical protein
LPFLEKQEEEFKKSVAAATNFGDVMRGIHQSDSAEVSEKALGQLKIMLDVLKYYRTPLVRPAVVFLISAFVRLCACAILILPSSFVADFRLRSDPRISTSSSSFSNSSIISKDPAFSRVWSPS